jgi:hypothetical protein
VDDADASGTSTTADVVIRGYYSDGTQIWSSNQDKNWDSPASFTANRSGTVYIEAILHINNSRTFTHGIVFSTSTTRPTATPVPSDREIREKW